MKNISILLLCGLFLSACVANTNTPIEKIQKESHMKTIQLKTQSNEIIATYINSSHSIPKLQKDWKQLITNTITDMLKDPDSAKFTFINTPKYYIFSNRGYKSLATNTLICDSKSPIVGYSGIVFVNAKNSFGGYTGNKAWWYIISEGRISLLAENDSYIWNSMEAIADHMDYSYAEKLVEITK